MRVVAGRARGMRLQCPAGDDVRPVPDMAREAIFNILHNEVEGAVVLDLFAGAGTMGIEALSRGAQWCVFVESAPQICSLLERNLAHTRLAEFGEILQQDVRKSVPFLVEIKRTYDLVFACPPFSQLLDKFQANSLLLLLLEGMAKAQLLNSGAQVILQHEQRSAVSNPPPGFTLTQQRTYGRNIFSFYAPQPNPE